MVKFRCSVNDGEYEEIVAYNDFCRLLEAKDGQDGLWHFKKILSHSGPLKKGDKDYIDGAWNVQILWETGETTATSLNLAAKGDWHTCVTYAKKAGLLKEPGWKRFAKNAKHDRTMFLVHQAQLRSYKHAPIYKYGYQAPRNYAEARALDAKNGNTRWAEAEDLELHQIYEYETFEDLGRGATPPHDYKRVDVHFVYDIKHDGRHKARLVAGGHRNRCSTGKRVLECGYTTRHPHGYLPFRTQWTWTCGIQT